MKKKALKMPMALVAVLYKDPKTGRKYWIEEERSAEYAEHRDISARCIHCGEPVRRHLKRVTKGPQPHFEHQKDGGQQCPLKPAA